jgi:hypothetical protein
VVRSAHCFSESLFPWREPNGEPVGHWILLSYADLVRRAELLGIPVGEPLLARAALQQSNGIRRASRFYRPFSVAEHTPWADNPHLLPAPKLYDYFSRGGRKLTWTEHVRARMPIGDETLDLEVPPACPCSWCCELRKREVPRAAARSPSL